MQYCTQVISQYLSPEIDRAVDLPQWSFKAPVIQIQVNGIRLEMHFWLKHLHN